MPTDPSYPDGPPIAETQRKRSAVIEAMGVDDYVQTISAGAPPGAPVNTERPHATVDGTGAMAACTMGIWDNMFDEPHRYAYRWFRGQTAIPDATQATYSITAEDIGALLTCVVQATNALGDAAIASNQLEVE